LKLFGNNLFSFSAEEIKDEPCAWEAREFLRKKLVGESVLFTLEKPPNATREYGTVYLGKGN
jgi:staphylococcal nuclease domain-containing protein 1